MDKSEEYFIKVSKAHEIQRLRPIYLPNPDYRIGLMGDWFTNKEYFDTKYNFIVLNEDTIVEIDKIWLPSQSQLIDIVMELNNKKWWWHYYHRNLNNSPYSHYSSPEIAGLHYMMESCFNKWWNDETETWEELKEKTMLPPEVKRKYKFRYEE